MHGSSILSNYGGIVTVHTPAVDGKTQICFGLNQAVKHCITCNGQFQSLKSLQLTRTISHDDERQRKGANCTASVHHHHAQHPELIHRCKTAQPSVNTLPPKIPQQTNRATVPSDEVDPTMSSPMLDHVQHLCFSLNVSLTLECDNAAGHGFSRPQATSRAMLWMQGQGSASSLERWEGLEDFVSGPPKQPERFLSMESSCGSLDSLELEQRPPMEMEDPLKMSWRRSSVKDASSDDYSPQMPLRKTSIFNEGAATILSPSAA